MRGARKTHEINGVRMSRLKHDRIRALEAQLPQFNEVERLGAEDIAARISMSATNVRLWLRILGVRLHNRNNRFIFRHDKSGWKKKILPVYKAKGWNATHTADALGMDRSTVYRWLANNGHLHPSSRRNSMDISDYKFQSFR